MLKKSRLLLLLLATTLAACTNTNPDNESSSTPASSESVSSEVSSQESSSQTAEELTIADVFPFEEKVLSTFAGEGNEFASFTRYPQYIEDNRMQVSTNNGGTINVSVYVNEDGTLTQTFSRSETYFRENMLDKTSDNAGEILLKEPLQAGTSWENPNGSTAEITGVDVEVETGLGNFSAVEVTTTEGDAETVRYYVKDMGLVRQEVKEGGETLATSILSERAEETPETQLLTVYFPDMNVMGLDTADINASFFTNDVTRTTFEDLMQDIPGIDYAQLISDNTTFNSLYLNDDGRVYADFSRSLIDDMNAGSSGESLIVQGIVNTLGMYYGVTEVVLTVDGEPYVSGHYNMQPGESFKVDLEQVNQ